MLNERSNSLNERSNSLDERSNLLNERSISLDEGFISLNETSIKLDEASISLNEASIKPDGPSISLNERSVAKGVPSLKRFAAGLSVRLVGLALIWLGDGSAAAWRKALVIIGIALSIGGIAMLRYMLFQRRPHKPRNTPAPPQR